MKKHEIVFGIIKIPLDFLAVILSFFLARNIREVTDLIPGVSLPSQTIANENLIYFALTGAILYVFLFAIHGLYALKITSSKIKETIDILRYSIYCFIFYSALIYFAKDFLYTFEIPRLVILFSFIISTILVIIQRIILNNLQSYLIKVGKLYKRNILLISNRENSEINEIINDINSANIYNIIGYSNKKEIKNQELKYIGSIKEIIKLLSERKIDEILYIDSDFEKQELYEIWDYSRIYAIRYRYLTNSFDITSSNTSLSLINKIATIEIKNTKLDGSARVIKRSIDIVLASLGIIIFFPLMLIVGIIIKIEDPKGPIVYKNKRVGQNGEIFNAYKFRYLKWEFCTKQSYGLSEKEDKAIKIEKNLIKEKSERKGPLYKIKNDPRKTKIGNIIEKYSIDELAQLFNVIAGNMSLVGPRPHQVREVNLYKDQQKRVLTIKPGITGMAQVNGREKNNFEDEVKLDIFYIENWNLLLDLKIIFKTFGIIFNRK